MIKKTEIQTNSLADSVNDIAKVNIKGDKKKPNKSFDIFLCLNPRFRGQKWAQSVKFIFLHFLFYGPRSKKRMENMENDVLKKM